MDEELEWTRRLGDAFLCQEDELMKRVHFLRDQACQAGNLESTEYARVPVRQTCRLRSMWSSRMLLGIAARISGDRIAITTWPASTGTTTPGIGAASTIAAPGCASASDARVHRSPCR
jgi:hypothetical protein